MIYFPNRADPVRSEKSPRGIWGQHSGTEADFRLLHVNIHANNVTYSLIHHQWANSGPIKGRRSTHTWDHPITREYKKKSIQISERYLLYRPKDQKIVVLMLYYTERAGEIVF
jgi:hypothetical protein